MYPPPRQSAGRPLSVGFAALAAVAVLVASSASAAAYERTQTCDSYGTKRCEPDESPTPIAWPTRCVRYHIHEAGTSDFSSGDDGADGEQLHRLVRRAFETWNAADCTDFTLVEGSPTSKSASYDREAGLEGNTNVIQWRDEEWPHTSIPSAFALTSVSFTSDGAIEDADIEFNSSMYDFAHLSESKVGEMTTEVDLTNTLTHEIGHLVGLAHAEQPEATMYDSAQLGEIRKRTLHRDDLDGLCAIYPGTKRQGPCDDPEDFRPPESSEKETESETQHDAATEPTCSTTGRRPTPGFLAAALAGLFAVNRRTRRRR